MKKRYLVLVCMLVFIFSTSYTFFSYSFNKNINLKVGGSKNIIFRDCVSDNENVYISSNNILALKEGKSKLTCSYGISYNINIDKQDFNEGDYSADVMELNVSEIFNIEDVVKKYYQVDDIEIISLLSDSNGILVREENNNYMAIGSGTVSFFVKEAREHVLEINFIDNNTSNATINTKNWRHYYPDVLSKKELKRTLTTNEKNYINKYIIKKVDKKGYGTNKGVSGAAYALIKGAYYKDLFLPYYFGGGHNTSSVTIGVDSRFGQRKNDWMWQEYNKGRGRNYYSYDCSALVVWAIKNGCNSNFSNGTNYYTGSMYSWGSSSYRLSDAEEGDLMLSGTHVRLILKRLEDGSVVVAESTSQYSVHGGVQFQRYTYLQSGYRIIKMKKFYERTCKKSR